MEEAKIYVGNLAYETTADDLRELFSAHGEIKDVKLITDFETGRSKGFAFITFVDQAGVESALSVNGTDVGGRQVRVSVAEARKSGGRPPRR